MKKLKKYLKTSLSLHTKVYLLISQKWVILRMILKISSLMRTWLINKYKVSFRYIGLAIGKLNKRNVIAIMVFTHIMLFYPQINSKLL